MTDIAELRKRKEPINLAIVHVDPDAFIASYAGWLEITAFLTAVKAGHAASPVDGMTPALSAEDFRKVGVREVGDDAIFAFAMTAAMAGEAPALDKVEAALRAQLGAEFPGCHAMSQIREVNETPIKLEEFVAQAARKLLAGELAPPPLRAKETWLSGLRFFEKARRSNFVHEIMYPLARWVRARWTLIAEKEAAFLVHIEDNLPILRHALEELKNDQAFIANLLLKAAPAVDMELTEDYEGFLRSLARRA
jgi:hypothetical protein